MLPKESNCKELKRKWYEWKIYVNENRKIVNKIDNGWLRETKGSRGISVYGFRKCRQNI